MGYVDKDIRGENGKWILRWGNGYDGTFTQTRIGRLHNNMTQRARAGGSYQTKFQHSYTGVGISDEFKDPQRFGDWCVKQIGWGLGYQLDKDLLMPGNRVYCSEWCVFLPGKINSIIALPRRKDSTRLHGAYYTKRGGWYSQITVDGKDRQLGRFSSEQEAHDAYCAYKEEVVKALATQYRDTIDPRAFSALMLWTVNRNSCC